jgi:hypothetical protein
LKIIIGDTTTLNPVSLNSNPFEFSRKSDILIVHLLLSSMASYNFPHFLFGLTDKTTVTTEKVK